MLNPWLYCFLYSTNLTWRDVQYLIAYSSNYDVPRSDDWVKNSAGLWGECKVCSGLRFAWILSHSQSADLGIP